MENDRSGQIDSLKNLFLIDLCQVAESGTALVVTKHRASIALSFPFQTLARDGDKCSKNLLLFLAPEAALELTSLLYDPMDQKLKVLEDTQLVQSHLCGWMTAWVLSLSLVGDDAWQKCLALI